MPTRPHPGTPPDRPRASGPSTSPDRPPAAPTSPSRASAPPAITPSTGPLAVEVHDLAKTYGRGARAVHALAGVDLAVPAGSVYALLGPNGAGKSTTVRILATLSTPDAGTALVCGQDVVRRGDRVRRVIGYVSQRPGFDPMGTGRENLVLAARLQGLSARESRRRADELLERFGLGEAGERLTGRWSGGMQRKLDVALGLVHRPRVLFLDEPTTGLDPQARTELWSEVAGLTRDEGLTVLLTTHYLDEADRVAGQVAIVDRGRVVAQGTPERLKDSLGGDTVQVVLDSETSAARVAAVLRAVPGLGDVRWDDAVVRAHTAAGAATLPHVLSALAQVGEVPVSVALARPSLDEVYLRHAGRVYSADADGTPQGQAGAPPGPSPRPGEANRDSRSEQNGQDQQDGRREHGRQDQQDGQEVAR